MEAASILKKIIDEAVKNKASDIILTFGCPPALKMGGKMVKTAELPVMTDTSLAEVVKQIIPHAKLLPLEKDRQTDFAYEVDTKRFRVNVFYQREHLSVVMRYVQDNIPNLEDLGLPEVVQELIAHDNGLLLMVGPTGSGKSTSLAAMVDNINANSERHIITIEDPIEYVYSNKQSIIEQREIGVDAVDFPTALRSALREAPDVVLLGEMRDLESISTAITVAETGHLVLSTIHANNAAGTIDRIIDVFPAGYKDQVRIQLADILVGVLNQRLVPAVDGGFKLICEVMVANSAVRNAIRTANTAQLPSIIQTSSADGMHLLDELLVKAVARGEITKEIALSFAQDRNELRKNL